MTKETRIPSVPISSTAPARRGEGKDSGDLLLLQLFLPSTWSLLLLSLSSASLCPNGGFVGWLLSFSVVARKLRVTERSLLATVLPGVAFRRVCWYSQSLIPGVVAGPYPLLLRDLPLQVGQRLEERHCSAPDGSTARPFHPAGDWLIYRQLGQPVGLLVDRRSLVFSLPHSSIACDLPRPWRCTRSPGPDRCSTPTPISLR